MRIIYYGGVVLITGIGIVVSRNHHLIWGLLSGAALVIWGGLWTYAVCKKGLTSGKKTL